MTTVRSCAQLLEQFPDVHKRCTHTALYMKLNPSDHRDVYNISAPFVWENETLLLGRTELRDNESSETLFFTKQGDDWIPIDGYESLKVQDPSFSRIGGMLVIAVVQTYNDPFKLGKLTYRTIFYRGKSPRALTRFAQGPEHMKDIRLLQLDENRILVFTRPQGAVGGRGTIGYTIISSLDELNPWSIESARLLDQQFIPEEWGGANELHLLKNGKVGVLSHIARFDDLGNRHYYSTCFLFEPDTGNYLPMKLIAVRDNFQVGASKRPDLTDVIFSGGLVRNGDSTATLYCGAGDAEAHRITIADPFDEWEK